MQFFSDITNLVGKLGKKDERDDFPKNPDGSIDLHALRERVVQEQSGHYVAPKKVVEPVKPKVVPVTPPPVVPITTVISEQSTEVRPVIAETKPVSVAPANLPIAKEKPVEVPVVVTQPVMPIATESAPVEIEQKIQPVLEAKPALESKSATETEFNKKHKNWTAKIPDEKYDSVVATAALIGKIVFDAQGLTFDEPAQQGTQAREVLVAAGAPAVEIGKVDGEVRRAALNKFFSEYFSKLPEALRQELRWQPSAKVAEYVKAHTDKFPPMSKESLQTALGSMWENYIIAMQIDN